MKTNNNPWIWGLITLILGWWALDSGSFEDFTILAFAVVIMKLTELFNLINKDN